MATISVQMINSQNGVISKSFNMSENDMNRIYKALNHVYKKGSPLELPTEYDDGQPKQDFTLENVCTMLAEGLMKNVLETVRKVEVELIYQEIGTKIEPLNVTSRD